MPFIGVRRALLVRKKLPASGGGSSEQTVLFDVSTTTPLVSSGNNVLLHTLGAGSTPDVGSGSNGTNNLCLIAAVMFGSQNGGTSTVSTMFWDTAGANQTFTQIPGAIIQNGANGGDIVLYYVMSPTIGSKNFSMTWTGLNQVSVAFVSFVNVDQTGAATTFPTVATNTGTANPPSVTISTSPTTRKIVGAFSSLNNFTGPASPATDIGANLTMNVFAVGGDWDNGTATSIGYSTGGSSAFAGVAAVIKGV